MKDEKKDFDHQLRYRNLQKHTYLFYSSAFILPPSTALAFFVLPPSSFILSPKRPCLDFETRFPER